MIVKDLTSYIPEGPLDMVREQLREILMVLDGKLDQANFTDLAHINKVVLDSLYFFQKSVPMEHIRIVRGIVGSGGTVLEGLGWSVANGGVGINTVTFLPAFAGLPTILKGDCREDADIHQMFDTVTASTVRFITRTYPLNAAVDARFHFAAIGPVT